MQTTYGDGGWFLVEDIGLAGALYVRVERGAISELYLKADAGQEITAAQLRQLPLARILTAYQSRPDLALLTGKAPPKVDLAKQAAQLTPRRAKGRADGLDTSARLTPAHADPPSLSEDFLKQVAAAYLAAVARGERPNVALARQVGHQKIDGTPYTRNVERWVFLARKSRLLPKARPGRTA